MCLRNYTQFCRWRWPRLFSLSFPLSEPVISKSVPINRGDTRSSNAIMIIPDRTKEQDKGDAFISRTAIISALTTMTT